MKMRLWSFIVLAFLMSCDPNERDIPPEGFGPPLARLRVEPSRGDSTIAFVLSAKGSRDADHIEQLLRYRWDLNNDSIWDTEYSDYPYLIKLFPDTGKHEVRVEVIDRFGQISTAESKLFTWGAETDTSSFRDPRDGQVYKTVRLFGFEWMAENLNYGSMIPVSDTVYDDGIVHKYCYQNNPDYRAIEGGAYTFYDWDEAMNYDTISHQGICPPGWELPTRNDWQLIIDTHKGLVQFYSEGGFSNLNLTRIAVQQSLQEWLPIDTSPYTSYWMYLSRNFERYFWDDEECVTPYVASSRHHPFRGYIYPLRYVDDSIRNFIGIAPIRCIKRD